MARWKLTDVVRAKVASLRADIKAMGLSARQVTVRLTGRHAVDVTIRDERVSLAGLAPLAPKYAEPAHYYNNRQVNPRAFAVKVAYAATMYTALANALAIEFGGAEMGYTMEVDGLFRVTKRYHWSEYVHVERAGACEGGEGMEYFYAAPLVAQLMLDARACGKLSILPRYLVSAERLNWL